MHTNATDTDSSFSESKQSQLRSNLRRRPELMTVRDGHFVRKLLEQLVMLGGGSWIALSAPSVWLRLAGVLILGAAYARNLELMHECMHFTALRSFRANRFLGVLLGLPMLTSFEEWRRSHLRHHADVRNEFQFSFDKVDNWGQLLRCWLMLDHYRNAYVKMVRSLWGGVDSPNPIRRAVNREHFLMAALHVAALAVTITLRTPAFIWLWLLPLMVASVVNFHIQLPEHYECDTSSNQALRNSRSIRASRAAAWFVNNNHLHASHHWMAAMPIAHLPQLDRELRSQVDIERDTYPRFFRKYYAHLWRNFRAA
jgi:fatty acid desaturase